MIKFLVFAPLLVLSIFVLAACLSSLSSSINVNYTAVSSPTARVLDVVEPKRRMAFIDLGAHTGDTLAAFVNGKFPVLEGTEPYEYEVFLFEGHPMFNEQLLKMKSKYASGFEGKPPMKIKLFSSTVVGVKSGNVPFIRTRNKDGNSIFHRGRKSLDASTINVTEIDFPRWLVNEFDLEDYVIVKMDIEGSEFVVLPKLVDTNAHLLIDTILVEWHDRFVRQHAFDKNFTLDAHEAVDVMKKAGIQYVKWS